MPKPPIPKADDAAHWLSTAVPHDWFDGPLDVRIDKDEIVIIGSLAGETTDSATDPSAAAAASLRRIHDFREETRGSRMKIAEVAQLRWRRIVSWGVRCDDAETMFTHAAVPVMTRLTFDQRAVLDTLVDSGVAGSRSEALAWCVGQVGEHQSEWIDRLRDAIRTVEAIRAEGPPR